MHEVEKVVVTGIEAYTVLGGNKDMLWEGLIAGKSAIHPESKNHERVQSGNKVTLLLEQLSDCLQKALHQAGISQSELEMRNAVFICGTFLGEFGCLQNDISVQGHSFDVIPKVIQIRMGFIMPVIVLSNACASGIQVIGLGMDLIRQKKFDLAIICAYEAIDAFVLAGMASIRSLGSEIRPFDAKRNGTVLGDGIGAVILETEKQALARNAEIYAEVLGCGMSNDAYHYVRPHPQGTGIINSIKMALEDSGLSINDIDYICAHGTGTKANDSVETKAIKTVFGNIAYQIPVSSIKGSIGHSLGASGILSSIATILSIKKNYLLPTINYENMDPSCDLDYIPNISRAKKVERALCHAFGFGGVNGVLALGRYSNVAKAINLELHEQRGIHIDDVISMTLMETEDEFQLTKKIFGLIKQLQIRSSKGQSLFTRMGVVMDVSDGIFPSQKKFHKELCEKDLRLVNPSLFCYSFPNRITGEIAREFGISGPTLTICDSEPSLEKAFWVGQTLLSRNKSKKVLIGKIGKGYCVILIAENTENYENNKNEFDFCVQSLMNKYKSIPWEVENAI